MIEHSPLLVTTMAFKFNPSLSAGRRSSQRETHPAALDDAKLLGSRAKSHAKGLIMKQSRSVARHYTFERFFERLANGKWFRKHKINLIFLHSLSVRWVFDLILNENSALFVIFFIMREAPAEEKLLMTSKCMQKIKFFRVWW
jgi:hypothetical protein